MSNIDQSTSVPSVFNFNSHQVRTINRDGIVWFVAADVCSALGYANPSKAIADHLDDDERSNEQLDRSQMGSKAIIINESGLYALVLRSRKPEARKFAKWVTSEVLPTIRKTGEYRTPYVSNPDDILTAAQAEELRLVLKETCDKLPKEKQAQFMVKGWAKLKSHFGVKYRQIPQREFTEAVSLLTRHAAEWELVDDTPKTQIAMQPAQSESNFNDKFSGKRWILSFVDGVAQTTPCPDNAVIGTPMELVSLIRDRKNSPFDMVDVDDIAAACRSRELGFQLAILDENAMLKKILVKCGAIAES